MKKVILILFGLFTLTGCMVTIAKPNETETEQHIEPEVSNEEPNNPIIPDPVIPKIPTDPEVSNEEPNNPIIPDPVIPKIPTDPEAPVGSRVEMSETEIKDYLEDRTFLVSTHLDGIADWSSYGSGWLFDVSEDNWYIATNRHVTEKYANSPSTQKLCISNMWDDMRKYYNYEKATGEEKLQNVNVYIDRAIEDVAYPNCVQGELVYENDYSGIGHDYFDFSVVRISRSDLDPDITENIEPLKLKIKEDASIDFTYHQTVTSTIWEPVYNISSGRGRWGSFFNQTTLIDYNDKEAKYYSDYKNTAWVSNSEKGTLSPLETGFGSSGSAFVDKYGEVVGIVTYNYSAAVLQSEYEIANNPTKNKNISGTSSSGIIDVLIPEYVKVLNEITMLNP